MFTIIGAVLILLGILGLVGLIGTGLIAEIILIALGIAAIAYEQGGFGSRRNRL
jgi:hypothetical protein